MTWARFDDRTPSNPKVALLSDAAFRLWFTAICYCCEHLTDGAIHRDVPQILSRAPSGAKLKGAITELVNRGLWDETDHGWDVHDFLNWNPSGEQVRSKREARAKAGANGGKRSGEQRASKQPSKPEAIASPDAEQTGSYGEAKTNPVPVPVPVPMKEEPLTPFSDGRSPRQDPFMDSLTGRGNGQRADVLELFAAWAAVFGGSGAKLRKPVDERTQVLAEAIDTHGLDTCKLVLANAPNDAMVTGKADDKGVKHDTVGYIFGNVNAFERILRAANEASRRGPGNIRAALDAARAAQSGVSP
jgi:hypothetical protein